jgi:hypothetical protein
MTPCEHASFAAGQDCGTRVAACLARLTALELLDGARWWNRWRRRLMAGALVACAEDLERSADAAVSLRPSERERPEPRLALHVVTTIRKKGEPWLC